MEFTTIYRNGRPDRFFIRLENPDEFNFLQPYFLATSLDHPRKGQILEMNCLFSNHVWEGRQRHGYGYACSHDVYGTLLEIIWKMYGTKLSAPASRELRDLPTHDARITLSQETLAELSALNRDALERKYST